MSEVPSALACPLSNSLLRGAMELPCCHKCVNDSAVRPKLINRYVGGEVHASDGGRCHPSIREDILPIYQISYCTICMCVPLCDISIMLPH